MRLAASLVFCALAALPPAPAKIDLAWEASVEAALARAAEEEAMVFAVLGVDDEPISEALAKDVYGDKRVSQFASETVNLVGCMGVHTKGKKPCRRYGTVRCAEHEQVVRDLRELFGGDGAEGELLAPQHVWMTAKGKVLLSAPYGLSVPELEWCFAAARKALDPELEVELSKEARVPRQARLGLVLFASPAGQVGAAPPDRAEVERLLERVQRGNPSPGDGRRLAEADDEDARDFVLTMLRDPNYAGRGSGKDRRPDYLGLLLRWVGSASPPSYWEIAAEFSSSGELMFRSEAAVALEELAAPESLKAVTKAVKLERDELVKKNLLRALGAVGASNSGARKLLLKQADDNRNELWKLNAILALGSLSPHKDVQAFLTETMRSGEGDERRAAVLAAGLSRDVGWLKVLRELEGDARFEAAVGDTIAILEGAPLRTIREHVEEVGRDEIPRRRLWRLPVGAAEEGR